MLPGGVGGPGRPAGEVRVEQPQGAPALRAGDVVTAAVEAVEGDVAWLRLAGQLVKARAELALKAGDLLTLLVQSADGPLWLRRIDTAARPAAPGQGAPAQAQPGAGAEAPGAGAPALPGAEQLSAAVRALVAYRLPPEAAQVDRLARLAAQFPAAEQEQAASAAAWLVARGVTPTPDAVRQLLAQTSGPVPLALRPPLEALVRALRQTAAAAAAGGNTRLAEQLGALADELESWGWHAPRPDRPPAAAPAARTQTPAARPEAPAARPEAPPERPVAQPEARPRTLPTALQEARELLQGAPAGPGRAAARAALADAAGLLANVRRQLQPPPGAQEPAWSLVPLPVHLPHWQGDVLLARRRQEGRGPGAAAAGAGEELHLFLLAPHLGALAVHLRLEGGAVGATVTASSEAARADLAAALPDLAADLAAAGVPVGRLAAVAGNPAPPPVLLPPEPHLPARLDLKL